VPAVTMKKGCLVYATARSATNSVPFVSGPASSARQKLAAEIVVQISMPWRAPCRCSRNHDDQRHQPTGDRADVYAEGARQRANFRWETLGKVSMPTGTR